MPLREVDLDALMSRLACGDRSAFEPLYVDLWPRALRLARARLGPDRADDAAQSALLKVFARASDFMPGRPCLPWFYAVLANEVRGVRRRDARLVSDEGASEALVTAEDPESLLARRELERALELAVDALEDDAANAIRAMLGRAPEPAVNGATFRKRVSRAYAKLRLMLGGHDVG